MDSSLLSDLFNNTLNPHLIIVRYLPERGITLPWQGSEVLKEAKHLTLDRWSAYQHDPLKKMQGLGPVIPIQEYLLIDTHGRGAIHCNRVWHGMGLAGFAGISLHGDVNTHFRFPTDEV